MLDLARLVLEVDSRKVKDADRNLDDFGKSARDAEKNADRFAAGANRSMTATDRMNRSVGTLTRALAGLGLALGTAQIIAYADAWTNASNRIAASGTPIEMVGQRQAELADIARRSRSDFEATIALFSRMSTISDQLGASQEDLLRITETVNKAMALGGATAQASAAAITQLGQALGSGALRGDEFNSIAENSTELMQIIARHVGVTTGELRRMAEQGELTSRVLYDALAGAAERVDERFSRMEITFGQAMTNLRTSVIEFVGGFNEATGFTANLSGAVLLLSENLDLVVGALTAIAVIMGARVLLGFAVMVGGWVAQLVGFVRFLIQARAAATGLEIAMYALGRASAFMLGLPGLIAVGIIGAVVALTNRTNNLTAAQESHRKTVEAVRDAYRQTRDAAEEAANITALSTALIELEARMQAVNSVRTDTSAAGNRGAIDARPIINGLLPAQNIPDNGMRALMLGLLDIERRLGSGEYGLAQYRMGVDAIGVAVREAAAAGNIWAQVVEREAQAALAYADRLEEEETAYVAIIRRVQELGGELTEQQLALLATADAAQVLATETNNVVTVTDALSAAMQRLRDASSSGFGDFAPANDNRSERDRANALFEEQSRRAQQFLDQHPEQWREMGRVIEQIWADHAAAMVRIGQSEQEELADLVEGYVGTGLTDFQQTLADAGTEFQIIIDRARELGASQEVLNQLSLAYQTIINDLRAEGPFAQAVTEIEAQIDALIRDNQVLSENEAAVEAARLEQLALNAAVAQFGVVSPQAAATAAALAGKFREAAGEARAMAGAVMQATGALNTYMAAMGQVATANTIADIEQQRGISIAAANRIGAIPGRADEGEEMRIEAERLAQERLNQVVAEGEQRRLEIIEAAERQAAIGGMASRDASIARATDAYEQQLAALREQGATQEEINRLTAAHEQQLENIRNPPSSGGGGGGGGRGGAANDNLSAMDQVRQQIEENIDALRREAEQQGWSREAIEAARIEQELLNAAKEDKINLTPAVVASIQAEAAALAAETEELIRQREMMQQRMDGLKEAQQLSQSFWSDVIGSLRQGKTAAEAFGQAMVNLGQKLVDMAMNMMIKALFNMLMKLPFFGGTSIGAGVLHSGGVAGTAGTYRHVDPVIFAAAPRLHNGLAPDEFPAILQRGERVIPKGGSANDDVPNIVIAPQFVVHGGDDNARRELQRMMDDFKRQVPGIALKAYAEAKSRRVA